MPGGLIELSAPGLGSSVQDHGRPGHRHEGIPLSGALDRWLADAANALVGNAAGTACIELRGPGLGLVVRAGPVRVAVAVAGAGVAIGQVLRPDAAPQALPAWTSATLWPGDRLQLAGLAPGCAYLALAGGVQVAPQLGSRSTYDRAGLGGLDGRLLRAGDRLPCDRWHPATPTETRSRAPFVHGDGPLRVLPGPQRDHFDDRSCAAFLATPWRVTPEQDRMGLRLAGPALVHRSPALADIVSDGVAPGAIQVPANGLPIVLLADGQTVGGYPKIATVISADLPRLAQAQPGQALRFDMVDAAGARRALQALQERWAAWVAGLEAFMPSAHVDTAALYTANLISGMIATGE